MDTATVLKLTGIGILGYVAYSILEASSGKSQTPAAQASIRATTPTVLNQLFTSDPTSLLSSLQQSYCANDEYYDRGLGKCVKIMSGQVSDKSGSGFTLDWTFPFTWPLQLYRQIFG